MPGQPWFESFFVQGRYAQELLRIPLERTEREVAFVLQVLDLPPGARVLDLCCGVGRHTVALAQRGYTVSGLDLDATALELAQQRAQEAGVQVTWHCADMRDIPYQGELDAVLCLFSSWGYYESDDEDGQVLAAVARALKPGGRFLLDTANRERIFGEHRTSEWRAEPDGTLVLTRRDLDLVSSRQTVTELFIAPSGHRSSRWHRFRFYTLTELVQKLRSVGLAFRSAWGDFDASPYTLTSRRMIVLAQKDVHEIGV